MEKYQSIFPMVYLMIAIIAAVAFHYTGVPDTIGGIIIGAAMTRVKIPAQMK